MSDRLLTIAIHVYSAALEFARKVFVPLLAGVVRRHEWNIRERQRPLYALRDYRNRTVVWLHAASDVESKMLMKFLDVLARRHPDDLYLVTARTRAGVEYLQRNRSSKVCAVGFLPFDTLPLMGAMIDRFGVSRVWLIESEFWPSMLLACAERKIPVGVSNARLSDTHYAWYRRLRVLVEPLLDGLDLVLAQNQGDAARLESLGVKRDVLHVVGNLDGYVVVKRPSREEWVRLRRGLNLAENSFVITAGCVHPGEGVVLRRSLDHLAALGHPCKCIIVPCAREKAGALLAEVGKGVVHLLDVTTRSSWEVCVVDREGILEDMYKAADVAVVGGTFVNVGGHSVWDPARFGIPVFFGPDYHMQTESCEKLLTAGVGFRAGNAEDLAGLIYKVVRVDARKFIRAQTLFMETVNKQQSVLEPLIP